MTDAWGKSSRNPAFERNMRRHDQYYTESNRLKYCAYLRERMIDEGVIVPGWQVAEHALDRNRELYRRCSYGEPLPLIKGQLPTAIPYDPSHARLDAFVASVLCTPEGTFDDNGSSYQSTTKSEC
jgi:hypothetical protein